MDEKEPSFWELHKEEILAVAVILIIALLYSATQGGDFFSGSSSPDSFESVEDSPAKN